MKYSLIPEGELYRLVAEVDIPERVKSGQYGGLVQGEWNLSQEGLCWIGFDAKVLGNAKVKDNAYIHGNAVLEDKAVALGDAEVFENARMTQFSSARDQAQVYGGVTLAGNFKAWATYKYYGHNIRYVKI